MTKYTPLKSCGAAGAVDKRGMRYGWALTEDLGVEAIAVVALVLLLAIALLVSELRGSAVPRRGLILTTGVLSLLLLGAAIFRPARVKTVASNLGARVLVLVDNSRRMSLRNGETPRIDIARQASEDLVAHFAGARLDVLAFSSGRPVPWDESLRLSGSVSDLESAVRVALAKGEAPSAIVVVSDGRFQRPTSEAVEGEQALDAFQGVVVHTVRVAERPPRDAAISLVRTAGVSVAHQSFALSIELRCSGALSCESVPVHVRELRANSPALELASGTAKMEDGRGVIELEIVLERAGARVVEVEIEAPEGDEISENNVRHLTLQVTRDRVRLLHLAGRPTYDVRALRRWLKGDEAVDLVAFFILRERTDDVGARTDELSLIKFPVDELFTEHLPSFDAIILQDIDANRYHLDKYLADLSEYVSRGGGLIMVGGPSSFAGGKYAGTPLDRVLPVEQPRSGDISDPEEFVPRYTKTGELAPPTHALRELLGTNLPVMTGTNLLGEPRNGALVLWEHPTLKTGGQPMPVLALGEAGEGRSIALSVDTTHRLAFGEMASEVAGRAYGALWDGLLGWLMRDPRYEAARVSLAAPCFEGVPAVIEVSRLPGMDGDVKIELERLGVESPKPQVQLVPASDARTVQAVFPELAAGGYSARVTVGVAPPTHYDFACEAGGAAFADTRPDPERLLRLAALSGGQSVAPDEISELRLPEATAVTTERQSWPLLPAWAWTLAASLMLGSHWILRRQSGLV
ncbi:MAG: hypothetical protein HRU17_02155 [Polyangiaceae bacterium]|nr:hypothetical protein [Polyangiaceae bacterium]